MTQLYYPLPREQVSEWPGDRGGYWHYGTDFAVPVDTPLPACFDGVIVFAGGDGAHGEYAPGIWANGEGLTVDILRSDGLRARYGHLNRIDVQVGQHVTAGQQIGLSGNTGYTTGPHCHWELRWDGLWSGGAWADPRDLGAIDFPPTTSPETKRKKTKLLFAYYADAAGKGQGRWAIFGPGFWLELSTQKAADAFAKQLGASAFVTDAGGWAKFKRASQP